MSRFEELAAENFPTLSKDAITRLLATGFLFDTHTHKLKEGMTEEHARAVLMLAIQLATECRLKLILSSDEQKLLGNKVVV